MYGSSWPSTGLGMGVHAPGSARARVFVPAPQQLPTMSSSRVRLGEIQDNGKHGTSGVILLGKSCLHDPCSASRISMFAAHMLVYMYMHAFILVYWRRRLPYLLEKFAACLVPMPCICSRAQHVFILVHSRRRLSFCCICSKVLHVCRACKSARVHGNHWLFRLADVLYLRIRPAATSSQPAVKQAGLRIGPAHFKTGPPVF